MDIQQDTSASDKATLNSTTQSGLGHALADLRSTVLQIQTPGVSPLAVLDASALDALKDVYYTVNIEDPLNAMPARSFVLEQGIVEAALLPLVIAVNSDPAAEANQKRWSVPVYYTLRLLSVLSLPISRENDLLKPGSKLDHELLKLRRDMASHRPAVHAFVSLLQYYVERKAEKQAAMASAEDAKLEDARIDIILRFFRNLLSPPRQGVGDDINSRDSGVHLALVGALVRADFYSTLAILFSSAEDATSQFSEIVFLVADIYAQTYRHSSPRQLYRSYREMMSSKPAGKASESAECSAQRSEPDTRTSVFEETPVDSSRPKMPARVAKTTGNSGRASQIRTALLRERAVVGGSRAITTSARWTSRHSGGILSASKPIQKSRSGQQNSSQQLTRPSQGGSGDDIGSVKKPSIKRVVSARNAIQSKLSLNPTKGFQDKLQVNSDMLCMLTARGKARILQLRNPKSMLPGLMRQDLQDEGLKGIVMMTNELIEMSFEHFIKALRSQIDEMKTRALGDEAEALMRSQKAFVCIVGSVVGFQREKYGKVFKREFNEERSLSAQIHENSMDSVLASDFKIAKEWKPVEAGIELESFQLVFRTLVDGFQSVKNNLKEEKKVDLIEHATFAILEMLKMLQSMVASCSEGMNEADQNGKPTGDGGDESESLSPRELALNTLEQLFEDADFLNAPAELARDFSTKLYSYRHLANVVEVTHAFAKVLLTESELAQIHVAKKKSKKEAKKDNGEKNVKDSSNNSESKENANNQADGPGKATTSPPGDKDVDAPGHGQGENAKTPSTGEDASKPDTGVNDNASNPKETNAVEKSAEGEEQLPKTTEESSSGEDTDDEEIPQMREVESVGIIRRFATPRAIQTLMLPLRAALCQASSLSGSVFNVPDGAGPILSPVVVAKSAHVLAAIWKVAKSRERGALCGSYFTYGTMYFMSTLLEAVKRKKVLQQSVLERMSRFAADVTKEFFVWLKQSSSLALDMYFPMDKGSCQAYATAIYRKTMLEQEKKAEESDSESEDERTASRRGNIDFEYVERRVSQRKATLERTARELKEKMAAIRRAERGTIEEDEDVDDIDNLDIGGGLESSDSEKSDAPTNNVKMAMQGRQKVTESEQKTEDGQRMVMDSGQESEPEPGEARKHKAFCRLVKKRRRAPTFDPFASDDEDVDGKIGKPARKPRHSRKRKSDISDKPDKLGKLDKPKKQNKVLDKETQSETQGVSQKIFESSDEYHEEDIAFDSSDDENGAQQVATGPVVARQENKRRRLVVSDDESE